MTLNSPSLSTVPVGDVGTIQTSSSARTLHNKQIKTWKSRYQEHNIDPLNVASMLSSTWHCTFQETINFKKAKWNRFSESLDQAITRIPPTPANYEQFVDLVKKTSRQHIPRGCRTEYIAGLNTTSKETLKQYQRLYEGDPFSEETIRTGETLLQQLAEEKSKKWCNLVEELDMRQNSRRGWKLLKNLNNESQKTNPVSTGNVTANQVAHHLLKIGQTDKKTGKS